MDEKDLEQKIEELKSNIEENKKDISTLWCWLFFLTIIVSIISISMLIGLINSLINYF